MKILSFLQNFKRLREEKIKIWSCWDGNIPPPTVFYLNIKLAWSHDPQIISACDILLYPGAGFNHTFKPQYHGTPSVRVSIQ